MLATLIPVKRYIGMLSIPRDLWVAIPGVGENRINTAHFFGESQQVGSGPQIAAQTVLLNFGVQPDYYLRVRFEGFREVINALGGVDIELTEPMAGYEPGKYHLTGNKALAFVRHRLGSDDFHRMQQGQFMMKVVVKNMLKPLNWPRLPGVAKAFLNSVDTNLPPWMWPRLVITLMLVGPNRIDNRIITKEMVTPFTTSGGASVLAPNWELINLVVKQMFLE
jgi:LCP family protein required for cell wall assembly